MIVRTVKSNIFETHLKHIVFAVNTKGFNDDGFAGQVSRRYWPSLEDTGGNELGEVLHHIAGGKTFHAIVCHDLEVDGWKDAPRLIEEGLNSIPGDEDLAVIMIGGGFVGRHSGADTSAILEAMRRSKKRVHVYNL